MQEIAWRMEQKGDAGDLADRSRGIAGTVGSSFERVTPPMRQFCGRDET